MAGINNNFIFWVLSNVLATRKCKLHVSNASTRLFYLFLMCFSCEIVYRFLDVDGLTSKINRQAINSKQVKAGVREALLIYS